MSKQTILDYLNRYENDFTDMAKKIWAIPQLAYEEEYAFQLQVSKLKEEGFHIKSNIGGIPTAFVAEYGSGRPIIGILGEYDALPGLSQSVSVTRDPIVKNGPGHGCGHNLLGTAGVEAVIALKVAMEKEGLSGTIRYYGCPAEEVLSGKTFMAREGVFDDLDCALTWHPGDTNCVMNRSMQAMVSIQFSFKGVTAHAASAPHAGRSALDAVELMNTGANYLREHVLDGTRIHYIITNGGLAPNIVPDEASVWYYLRATSKEEVDHLLERVEKIAQGAALMTETEVESEIFAYVYNTLPNESLNDLLYENMLLVEPQSFTEEEEKFAIELVQSTGSDGKNRKSIFGGVVDKLLPTRYINNKQEIGRTITGSTDVGDVSWITPVGNLSTTCFPVGVELHSWQATASFGSSIGFKGMHLAAKVMSLTAYDLMVNKDNIIEKARKEFMDKTEGKSYIAGIPNDVKPPVKQKTE